MPELRLLLSSGQCPIPYGPENRPDMQNFGYKSLLDNPKAIEDIPELVGEPEMLKLVAQINVKGHKFETVRIVHSVQENGGLFQRLMVLGIIFQDRKLFSSYDSCLIFAGTFLDRITQSSFDWTVYPMLEIGRARLVREDFDGWIMDVYLASVGKSEAAAKKNLNLLLQSLNIFD